ncbi:MAG: PspC domain-containing protein [Candidatus Heimdallarchaeota archaeon]|nr:PspC domain-containing protein [Candidatus Heimdallarchaeota archaeon]
MFCNNCGAQLTTKDKQIEIEGSKPVLGGTKSYNKQPTGPKRYYRSRNDRWISGVCGGLGEYFDIDPILVRIGFILFSMVYGAGFLVYILLAIIVEENPYQSPPNPSY